MFPFGCRDSFINLCFTTIVLVQFNCYKIIFIKVTIVRIPILEKNLTKDPKVRMRKFTSNDWLKIPGRNSVLNISNLKSSICYDLQQSFGISRRFSHLHFFCNCIDFQETVAIFQKIGHGLQLISQRIPKI